MCLCLGGGHFNTFFLPLPSLLSSVLTMSRQKNIWGLFLWVVSWNDMMLSCRIFSSLVQTQAPRQDEVLLGEQGLGSGPWNLVSHGCSRRIMLVGEG